MMNSPFCLRKSSAKGTKAGNMYYITKEIYLKFIQSGVDEKGEAIGEMIPKVKEIKTDLVGLINSHKDEVGVKNLIKLFNRTGDYSLFQARPTLPDSDYSQVLEDPGEIIKKLPKELVGDKSVEEFLKTLSPEQFQAWIKTLQPVEENTEKGNDE